MHEMKDSGVEWIGDIPAYWEIKKLKYLINGSLQYGANETGVEYDEKLPRYIRITDITSDNQLKENGKLSLPYKTAQPYLLKNNDILFARSGATVGKSFIYKNKYGMCAFAGYLIKASIRKNISPDFVYYYTLGSHYDLWKNRVFTQATIQNIGADKYVNLPVVVPPVDEQQKIASFLDKKCADIDYIISALKKQTETLEEYKKSLITEVVTKGLNPDAEMKDSGIEWIGDIPEHWETKAIREVFQEVTEKNKFGVIKNALKFTYGKIVRKENFDSDNDDYIANTILNYTIVEPDTIMLNGLNLNFDFVTQRVAIVEEKGIITSAYLAMKVSDDNIILPKYTTYLLKSYDYCKAFHNMGNGVRQSLNFGELKRNYIILPPIEEQQQIAEYLDRKCTEIDKIISEKKQQIKTMEEYKKSLIYEAVTGKNKVVY